MAVLERVTGRIGREAACAVEEGELSSEAVGEALGLSDSAARSRLTHYHFLP
ncbi:hypothetical protein [Streptomyces sp. NPDC093589]|uniref:hypothetical protein n=1 Tax=Streptomyces sp. NPDC093589 TaxID=3366043 RepID=UPI0037F2A02C